MSIAKQMQQLYTQFGDLPGITIELHKNLLAVRVENTKACATVFLQGAQVSHYQLKDQPPILWCSPLCDFQEGKSLRGGIPVCWPWFGDLTRNPDVVKDSINKSSDAPAHGTARQKPWNLTDIEILSDQSTRLTLTLALAENQDPYWPHASSATLSMTVGEQLALNLTIKNESPQTVSFSTALHSYFAISDISQVAVNGLDNLQFIDCMDDWNTLTQQGPLLFDQEVDRIYKGTSGEITLVDQQWKRIISVKNKNSHSAVLWNPWKDKAKRLSQFADEAYKSMLCIETANIGEDFVCLASGDSQRLELLISQHTLMPN
jgi:glucose-6-phosphate 1-epimerase